MFSPLPTKLYKKPARFGGTSAPRLFLLSYYVKPTISFIFRFFFRFRGFFKQRAFVFFLAPLPMKYAVIAVAHCESLLFMLL
jgi:hypothetical protein